MPNTLTRKSMLGTDNPRRFGGSLPEHRRCWARGCQYLLDTWRGLHSGWKTIGVNRAAATSCIACTDAEGGGGGRHRPTPPRLAARVATSRAFLGCGRSWPGQWRTPMSASSAMRPTSRLASLAWRVSAWTSGRRLS
eukprot:4650534-Pyramimonas_sp.AAC.1